jgi:hypothetical protein
MFEEEGLDLSCIDLAPLFELSHHRDSSTSQKFPIDVHALRLEGSHAYCKDGAGDLRKGMAKPLIKL